MEKFEEALEKLKIAVTGGREFFDLTGNLPSEYLTETVSPTLQDVLKYLCIRIEKRHEIKTSEGNNKFVIHYTSIATLVSMLQDASKNDKKTSLRLYDSVHFNDPDEGNYLRNLLPKKYDWLGKTNIRHAYVASFILPGSTENNMSDDLVFWRIYGKEGEGCSLSLHAPFSKLRKVFYDPEEKGVKSTVKELQSVLELLEPLVEIDNLSIRESHPKKIGGDHLEISGKNPLPV